MSLKVSDLFVRCLENEGVRVIFGVPGEENEDVLYSLAKSSIRFIPTRHEQGAAFMADVWGRLTGKAGVCLSTLGPGATNLMTGVADAFLDKSPLVAITGQGGLMEKNRESHQYLNVVRMFSSITKWNGAILHPDTVPEVVRKAFKVAEYEKPGATHIEIAEDMAKETAEGRPLPVVMPRRPSPDYKALERAEELLRKARKPLILAGNGAVRKLASKQLRRFSAKHHIPVVHTFMGQGAVSDACEESLHTIGLGFRDIVMDAVDQADLIMTVGYDISEYDPKNWNGQNDKTIIHLDYLPAEVYTHYQPAVEIIADVSASLWALNQRFKDTVLNENTWYRPVRKAIMKDIASYDLKDGDKFNIPGALNLIRSFMREDDLMISDVGSHKMWIARNFPVYAPNACIISNGLASMGIALPGAVAASLLYPDKCIVAAMGDGGFLMNSQELETAKRIGARAVIIIFNDNDYGLISWKQKLTHKHAVSTRLGNPDFKAYAESFGIKAYRPRTVAELRRQLKQAITAGDLCVMEIPVHTGVNMELVRKLKRRRRL